jgi:hypothetical protein
MLYLYPENYESIKHSCLSVVWGENGWRGLVFWQENHSRFFAFYIETAAPRRRPIYPQIASRIPYISGSCFSLLKKKKTVKPASPTQSSEVFSRWTWPVLETKKGQLPREIAVAFIVSTANCPVLSDPYTSSTTQLRAQSKNPALIKGPGRKQGFILFCTP